MKKCLFLFATAALSLLIITNDVNAFKGSTHRNITLQAINYLIQKGMFVPCPEIYDLIKSGSVDEDNPSPDPFPLPGTMRSWFHFSPALNHDLVHATCDSITWGFEDGMECIATTFPISEPYYNYHNWTRAVEGGITEYRWTDLGHVVHLLEDMGVPAHTRNDIHIPYYLDPDTLEEYVAEHNLLPDLPTEPLKPVSDPRMLLLELRNNTRSNYFSKDTCFKSGLPGPTDDPNRNTWSYFRDSNGKKIAHKGLAYYSNWPFPDKTDCTINDVIAEEQFQVLGPKAVLYAASLIKFYSDHTKTYPCSECPENYALRPSYEGDCSDRPSGSVCIGYEDGYIWLVYDSVVGWDTVGNVQIAYGGFGDYHHVLGTNCVQLIGLDTDGDLVPDASDNCPNTYNPDQTDSDEDGIGDVCECSKFDTDGDGYIDMWEVMAAIGAWKNGEISYMELMVVIGEWKYGCGSRSPSSLWPTFQYDPQHTGRSPYAGPQTNNVKWIFNSKDYSTFGTFFESQPAIGPEGKVYVGASRSGGSPSVYFTGIYAINPDGTLAWEYGTGDGVVATPSIALDGSIYFGSFDHNFYALNPDGTLKWKMDLGSNCVVSPTIGYDGTIYVGADKLYAINPNGTIKWSYEAPGHFGFAAPALSPDWTIYAHTTGDGSKLYALNQYGSLMWEYKPENTSFSASFRVFPVIGADGTIYLPLYHLGSPWGKLSALNPDRSIKWEATFSNTIQAPAIGPDGTLYVPETGSRLNAVNPDGSLKWQYTYETEVGRSIPIVDADGTIYVFWPDLDKLEALTPNGMVKWSSEAISHQGLFSAPAIGSDGTLLFGAFDKLYAFGLQ